MKFIFKMVYFGLLFLNLILFALYFADLYVVTNAKKNVYNSVEAIPYNKVGLLLGTNKHLNSGYVNLYYANRIEATLKLYKAGKIKDVIVSGDNSHKDYDETTQMMEDLVQGGIPLAHIYQDYAGFRTWDSMIRAKKVFGQDNVTVISQRFHNERALAIAHFQGMTAIGFNAKPVPFRFGFRVQVREKFARVKLLLDNIFGKKPKFLGDPIHIK